MMDDRKHSGPKEKYPKLKACPRCHGDLLIDRDLDGWYESCLQCGYRINLTSTATPMEVNA